VNGVNVEGEDKLWTTRFILLCVINFLLFMGFFFLLPTLPVYLVDVLGAREDQVGLIMGTFTIAAVLARPSTGYWLDRGKQTKIYITAIIIFLAATAGYMLAQTLLLLLILRFIHGFGFGMSTTAGGTMAATWIPATRRGEGIGYFGTFVMLAMSIGPLIGVFMVDQFSYKLMFVFCTLLASIGLVLSLFLQSPPRVKDQVNPHTEDIADTKEKELTERRSPLKGREKLRHWFTTLFEVRAIPVSLSMMMIAVVFGGVVTFVALYAAELGDSRMAGMYFMLYALSLVITRPFAGRWFDQKGPFSIVAGGTLLYFAGVILLGLATGPILFYLAAVVIGTGYGSLQPSYQALVIQEAAENRRGAATATFFTSFDIGVGFGAFILGSLVPWIGYGPMFLVSSIFLIFSFLLFYRFWKKKEKQDIIHLQEEKRTIQL
jgi:MFS family permease